MDRASATADCFGCGNRQFVTAFVFSVAGVTANDGECHLMLTQQLIQFLPEFDILDGGPSRSFSPPPAVLLPAGHPFHGTLSYIFAVGDDFDTGTSSESTEAFDDGLEFHLIIGGFRMTAAELAFGIGSRMPKNASPAARARISPAGSVAEQLNEWQ
jgi:hypothetical protein